MVGGVLTERPTSNSDNLQFPIVLIALGVGLRLKGRVYSILPYHYGLDTQCSVHILRASMLMIEHMLLDAGVPTRRGY